MTPVSEELLLFRILLIVRFGKYAMSERLSLRRPNTLKSLDLAVPVPMSDGSSLLTINSGSLRIILWDEIISEGSIRRSNNSLLLRVIYKDYHLVLLLLPTLILL